LAREALGATVVGCQTALPHALLPEYAGVATALAICPAGVVFDRAREAPKFVFMIVSSSRSHGRYLGVLARIARQMLDDEMRKSLLAAGTPTAVMELLSQGD
jgi:mannitol/fructose-specific phosphotransferase system IIA component (Ntr-type)